MKVLSLPAISDFFEHPQTTFAKIVHWILIFFIFFSAFSAFSELEYPQITHRYALFFLWAERIILFSFLAEYVLRFISAPKKFMFLVHPFNIVDLLAIIPFFFGINASIARVLRILRLLKLAKHLHLLQAFRFKNTILEKIFPLLILLSSIKIFVWILETHGLWPENQDLGALFSIIGFALGIILAEKVSATQGKYFAIRDSLFQLRGLLISFSYLISSVDQQVLREWLQHFLKYFHTEDSYGKELLEEYKHLFLLAQKYENHPADIMVLAKEITVESNFLLQKKQDFIPLAYNLLLQQANLLYLFLVTLFLPGATGLISVIIATYILYGLYHVTLDFDTAVGGEYNLINVSTKELESLFVPFSPSI